MEGEAPSAQRPPQLSLFKTLGPRREAGAERRGRGARGKRESPAAGRTRGRKKPGGVPLASGGGRERGQSEKEGAGQRRAERVERPLPAKGGAGASRSE